MKRKEGEKDRQTREKSQKGHCPSLLRSISLAEGALCRFSSPGTPALGHSQSACQDLITILVTQSQGGGGHLLKEGRHSRALRSHTQEGASQSTLRKLTAFTRHTSQGSLDRTKMKPKEKACCSAQHVGQCLWFQTVRTNYRTSKD